MTICQDCSQTIPAGHAVTRSIRFNRVTLDKTCAAARGWEPVAIPAQRVAAEREVVQAYAGTWTPNAALSAS